MRSLRFCVAVALAALGLALATPRQAAADSWGGGFSPGGYAGFRMWPTAYGGYTYAGPFFGTYPDPYYGAYRPAVRFVPRYRDFGAPYPPWAAGYATAYYRPGPPWSW